MLNSALIFVIICLVLILGIVSAHYKNYKKKTAELQGIYDGEWQKWSDVKMAEMPARQDEYDGSWIPATSLPYQDRYNNLTGEYQIRRI